ncbi:hypothetical protein DR_B0013 (plasmid) [Deinococcus radiodurans R1 = ATCC 13939 = DSM 20539]|uniref:Uncharacterized protein n=1 Tax=Deinococcus radiodurans (strain ATCC 13939 / DSM 20539 / JCM 16871 / CCUG 27074 / LMG 4051 / NBRC 15346 / NCIMB 9279 / VKM B-1422 / R1) TaxID=243230 RepID=Q9RZU8_DEIRA|nr:hypothetical protein DR_B0013 [Deinococcus radiodurans R1 = ATCC 13939 = DSM 20539]ANC73211.1 hypothetical protein A2G07_15255 [Deinococcus radiodurans R1 = ATCC 13939 = DSM 20539]
MPDARGTPPPTGSASWTEKVRSRDTGRNPRSNGTVLVGPRRTESVLPIGHSFSELPCKPISLKKLADQLHLEGQVRNLSPAFFGGQHIQLQGFRSAQTGGVTEAQTIRRLAGVIKRRLFPAGTLERHFADKTQQRPQLGLDLAGGEGTTADELALDFGQGDAADPAGLGADDLQDFKAAFFFQQKCQQGTGIKEHLPALLFGFSLTFVEQFLGEVPLVTLCFLQAAV